MVTRTERLRELGLELPEVVPPVADYIPAIVDRGMARTSGQLPMVNGNLICTGQVGEGGTDPEHAVDAARAAALNAIAAAAAAVGGLDKLAVVVKVTVFVSSLPDFYGQAQVANGASELLGAVFETPHIRSAVGVASLPLNAAVEVEAEFLVADHTQDS